MSRSNMRWPFCAMPTWTLYITAVLMIPVYLCIGIVRFGVPEAWSAFRSDWNGIGK